MQIQNLIFDSEPCDVLTFIDVSHIKELVRLERANHLIQLRESSVSHELVTPLRIILFFAQHLKEIIGAGDKRQLDLVEDIFITAKLLNCQMNDVLDHSTMSRRKLTPKIKYENLSKVVEETVRIIKPQAGTKKLDLVLRAPPKEVQLATDSNRVQQILVNLLTNALKFSPFGGQIVVTLESWFDFNNQLDGCRLSVQDQGIGIKEEEQALIFRPFF